MDIGVDVVSPVVGEVVVVFVVAAFELAVGVGGAPGLWVVVGGKLFQDFVAAAAGIDDVVGEQPVSAIFNEDVAFMVFGQHLVGVRIFHFKGDDDFGGVVFEVKGVVTQIRCGFGKALVAVGEGDVLDAGIELSFQVRLADPIAVNNTDAAVVRAVEDGENVAFYFIGDFFASAASFLSILTTLSST